MLNGDLEIISAPGEGTVALLSIPLDCPFPEEVELSNQANRLLPNQ